MGTAAERHTNGLRRFRMALRPPHGELGFLSLHSVGLTVLSVPVLVLVLAFWLLLPTDPENPKPSECQTDPCDSFVAVTNEVTSPIWGGTLSASLNLMERGNDGSLHIVDAELAISPINAVAEPVSVSRTWVAECTDQLLRFLATALIGGIVLVTVLGANAVTLARTRAAYEDHIDSYRRAVWPTGTQTEILLVSGVLAGVLAVAAVAVFARAILGPNWANGLNWSATCDSYLVRAPSLITANLLFPVVGTLLFANLYVAAVGIWGFCRAYPPVRILRRLRRDIYSDFGIALSTPAKDILRKMQFAVLPTNRDLGRMPISQKMSPEKVMAVLNLVMTPLVFAMIAGLTVLASGMHLFAFDPNLSDDANKAPAELREGWLLLLGAALSAAGALTYVPVYGRLRTYSSAAESMESPKETFSPDMVDYLGADATKVLIILEAARHGGGVQHLLNDSLTGSITKFLGLLAPAIAGGLLGLI